ncbi:uncharacterized protein K02A2.6-like [Corticium candelabrum]|uniref:uncharacterized protein K02A2.6-like n=1 Tax=Corticium candelabrum TaxID=121492 RepID=UPI002E270829|nr:uncharacterized protein K02A2.6-like [Corticium candelabrum]
MKSIARLHVWWSKIDSDIETLAKWCHSCQREGKSPPQCIVHPWVWPVKPMQRVHVDFAGPFMGCIFFLMVDAHSKWVEIIEMKSTTMTATIEVPRGLFASYGLPTQLVSDNGPQFVSEEFSQFVKINGIKHIKSATYHPAGNGQVDRAVQTFKSKLRSMEKESGTLSQKLCRFLLHYRFLPHATTGISPSELFLGRQLRTRLFLLKPDVEESVREKQAKQLKEPAITCTVRQFQPGDLVWAQDYRY